MKENSPNCYKCIHRISVPGSAHSECQHPAIPKTISAHKIKVNQHGIDKGWFIWPFNFDPVWLENCEGFEESEV